MTTEPHADLVRCPECQQDGCDLWEEIVTCPSCGHEWGVYETPAGIRLFMAEVAENDACLFAALERTDGS